MSKIVEFPGNRKILGAGDENVLIQEWMNMLKELALDFEGAGGSIPLPMKTYLRGLGHDEIIKMGQFLGFTELHFHGDEELLDFVVQQYHAYFPTLIARLPFNTLRLIRDMLKNEGVYHFDDATLMPEVIDLIYLGIGFLILTGDHGKLALVLTQDVVELLEQADWEVLITQGEENSLCLALVQGMLFCYGVMSEHEVLEVLWDVLETECSRQDVLLMLFLQCNLGATFATDGHLFWDNLVENPHYLYDQIVRRVDLIRKPYTKAQLLAYSSRPVTYSNNLTQWLQKGHRDVEDLPETLAEQTVARDGKVLLFSKKGEKKS